METLASLAGQLNQVNPAVLVTLVCIVALLVVAECVRQLCKALVKNKADE